MPTTTLKKTAKQKASLGPDAIPAKEAERMKAAAPPQQAPFLDDGFPNPRAAESVWDYMANYLKAEHWSQIIGYLYRIEPAQMRIEGIPAYLLKFQEPITLEMIKQKFGGRIFKLMLNRRVGGKEVNLFTTPFPIEAEPIIATGERWVNGAAAGTAASGPQSQLLEHLILDIIAQRDAAHAEGKQFNTSSYLATAQANGLQLQQTAFLESIKAMRATMDGNGGGGMNQIMQAFMLKAAEKMFAPPPDPMASLTGMLTMFATLKDTLGGSVFNSENPIAVIGGKFVDTLPTLLDKGLEISKNFRQTAELARTTARMNNAPAVLQPTQVYTPGQPMAPPVVAAPPPAAVFTPGIAFPPAAAPAASTLAENTTQPINNSATERERAYMRTKLVEVFQRGESGKLAAYILDLLRPDLAEELAGQIKANAAAVSALPEFLPIRNDARLPGFAFEFVTFFDEQASDSPAGGNTTQTPAAAPVAA